MSLLSLEDIENVDDINAQYVDVWGGRIKIKQMGFGDQLEYEKERNELVNDVDMILALLKYCIVDENNQRIFDKDSIDILKYKNSSCLFKIFKACLDLNSLNEHSVEDNAKN